MVVHSNKTSESVNASPASAELTQSGSEEEQWPGIDSRYRLIVVAALRSKQLLRGAQPRIDADPLKRRNTSIALEEVKRGLVPFNIIAAEDQGSDEDQEAEAQR